MNNCRLKKTMQLSAAHGVLQCNTHPFALVPEEFDL
jgi:hypothetical protein